jgi:hypothetical protein
LNVNWFEQICLKAMIVVVNAQWKQIDTWFERR